MNDPYLPPKVDSKEAEEPPGPPTGCGCIIGISLFAFLAFCGLPTIGMGVRVFRGSYLGGTIMIGGGTIVLYSGWSLMLDCCKWEMNRKR